MASRSKEMAREKSTNVTQAEPLTVVKVSLMGEVRLLAGRKELEVELPQGSTVQMLMDKLAGICGKEFARRVLTREGKPHPHMGVYLNEEDIRTLAGMETVLSGEKVELLMLPVYEGGSGYTQI